MPWEHVKAARSSGKSTQAYLVRNKHHGQQEVLRTLPLFSPSLRSLQDENCKVLPSVKGQDALGYHPDATLHSSA